MASCSICDDEITYENPLYNCSGCELKVHKLCYGIVGNINDWKCSLCQLNKTNFVKCQLCLQKGGAMKPTVCNKYVHVLCALFTSGVTFLDETLMEPIDISNVSSSKCNKICSFCYSTQGFASKCAHKKCKNRLHVTCAQKQKTLQEVVDSENDTIKFMAFCKDHKPKDSNRRLSSESVKNVVQRKRKNNSKRKPNLDDGNWILDEIQNTSTPAKVTLKRACKNQFCIIFQIIHYILFYLKIHLRKKILYRQNCLSKIHRLKFH